MPHRVDVDRGKWTEPTADTLENDLRFLVQDLMRESAKLGRIAPGSKDYGAQRNHISEMWNRFNPALSQLRAQITRETKRATRDALHQRLCNIQRQADADPEKISRPYIAWQKQIASAIQWLDRWTG